MVTTEWVMNKHQVQIEVKSVLVSTKTNGFLTLEEIEDLEMNLTDIIKQLQDYRLRRICA